MKSKIVAVTGGIGSGKSEVIKYLQKLGYATIDCDALAKEVALRPQTVDCVRRLLGDEYIVDGQLDRKAVRNTVFADSELLEKYNRIFFDGVNELMCERIAKLSDSVIFVEISVFDAFSYPWSEVWLVVSDDETRINRTIARDGSSRGIVENIISRQHICSDYTRIIENNGNLDELRQQVYNALQSI